MQKSSKQRTYAVAKFEQLEPSIEVTNRAQAALVADKAIAATEKDLLNFALEHKQEDLLYFKATYATCGFNLNDDVFINDEFWNARFSPILKPTDWQHQDKNIIGVIYAVEAQYLDGTQIDMQSDVVPKDDFELVVYGVVYKYTFAELADEIEKRSKAGKLYVSMETWFSDFAYALLDKDSSRMKVVGRNEHTRGLDKYLRVFGGSGEYNGQRIGRVLKGMTFGGMGIVDQPANPRSDDGQVIASTMEKLEMPETKETPVVAAPVVAPVVDAAKVTELESTVASLNTEKATASENLKRAEDKAKRAEDALKVAEGITAALTKAIDSAVAGFGTAVPPEIAAIDAAQTADAKYAAMISWISKTSNETFTAAAALKKEVESLKAQVAAFEKEKADAAKAALLTARTTEVETLFGKDAAATLMKSLSDLSDENYKARIEELKLVASKAKPDVRHDGAAGKPDAEGASGEGKAATGPREDRKIVASALENAAVEPALESGSGGTTAVNPFDGLAALVFKNKE